MFLIILISLIIYIIAGVMIYHNTYNLEQQKKAKLIICGVLATIIITIIIVNICSQGMKTEFTKQLSIIKIVSILLFSPINLILSVPYIGHILNEYEVKIINEEKAKKKLIILLAILILVGVFEINYIQSFQRGLLMSIGK